MEASAPLHDPLSGVVVVLLADFLRQHQGWGWLRLVAGPTPYKDVPGMTMAKVMGSGHGGGFSLRPSATHQGLICTFSHLDWAQKFLESPAIEAYRSRARECWTGVLAVQSARGHWDKQAWQASSAQALGAQAQPQADAANEAPLAVLTRASIVPTKAMAFWRYAPAAQADLGQAPGCLLAMGLGEVPLVRQCTFSLWKDTAAMLQYAHQGAHQTASAAAYKHQFFSESLFVRMQVLQMSGLWQGKTFNLPAGGRPPHGAAHPTGLQTQPESHDHALETSHV
ncbi:MAG: Spheroidene monooxygenase [Pseudomonadota bacterium]|jgi:spheroidene monooxygenase